MWDFKQRCAAGLDCNTIVLPVADVGCGGQCGHSVGSIPVGGDSGLWPAGRDGADETLLHGFWIHFEVDPVGFANRLDVGYERESVCCQG